MSEKNTQVSLKDLFKSWLPLAISWMMLSFEPQFFSSVISRFPNAEVNLAAYGNICWLIPVFIQSPIMLLQAASAALCKDMETFKKLRKFAYAMTIGLTLVHALVVLTPLYFFVTRVLFNLPEEVALAGRPGLILMLPWAGSITYRRFHQGILIRFGHIKRMSFGSILRLLSDIVCVLILTRVEGRSGLLIATTAQGFSVFLESAFIGIVTRPIIKKNLKKSNSGEIITWKEFIKYYTPLMVNSMLMILFGPIYSSALSRMPDPLSSLASWPVVNSFVGMINNLGQACREVTLTFFRKKESYRNIRKFSLIVGSGAAGILALFAFSPLLNWYLGSVVQMPEHLIPFARTAAILMIPTGVTFAMAYMYTGIVSYSGKTSTLLTATLLQLAAIIVCLFFGILFWDNEGIYVTAAVSTLAAVVQLAWLYFKNRDYLSKRLTVSESV
jgi:progressive ankylosis protein